MLEFEFEINYRGTLPIVETDTWVIVQKSTGRKWVASSGKSQWTSRGAAKGAFSNSHFRASNDLCRYCREYMITKRPSLFDLQDELEVITLKDALEKYGSE